MKIAKALRPLTVGQRREVYKIVGDEITRERVRGQAALQEEADAMPLDPNEHEPFVAGTGLGCSCGWRAFPRKPGAFVSFYDHIPVTRP